MHPFYEISPTAISNPLDGFGAKTLAELRLPVLRLQSLTKTCFSMQTKAYPE